MYLEAFYERYITRIGPHDHYNSSGQLLKKPQDIIRQDRANYHLFKVRDPEDHYDSFFKTKKHRALIGRMIKNGKSSKKTLQKILNGDPLIEVELYDNKMNIFIIKKDYPKKILSIVEAGPFVAVVGKNSFSYLPKIDNADDYGIVMTEKTFSSNHMIDSFMECKSIQPWRYKCEGDAFEYDEAHVVYHPRKNGFYLIFRSKMRELGGEKWENSEMRVFTKQNYIYEEYYSNGKLLRRDRYFIKSIK
jgi:hypothetical protein